MQMFPLAAAGLIALGMASSHGLLPPAQKAAIPVEPRLDSRITAPNRSEYRAIREERDWQNPHLSVSKSGFYLRSLSAPEPRLIALKDLRKVLTELPISDWPYGRVVVLKLPSIGGLWIATMQADFDGARKILKALDADEWGWPP